MANTILHKRGTTTPLAASLVTGELAINTATGSVFTKTDSGSVVNIGAGGVTWGTIGGSIASQGDLVSALDLKADLAGATFTGEVFTPASTTASAGLSILPGAAPSAPQDGEIWNTGSDLQVRLNGVTETVAEQSWVTAQGYLTSAPVASVAGRTGAITLAVGDVSGAAALAGATFTGLVGTVASATNGAGFNIPHGAAPTTPVNGDIWTTTSGLFMRQNGVTRQYVDFDGSQTINGVKTFSNASSTFGSSTATGTIGLATGATISGSTKTVNIGTGGVAGSTTNITLGTTSGGGATITLQNNTTVGGTLTVNGASLTLGTNTAAGTIGIGTGATVSGSTRTINIGTASAAGSTNTIVIGGGSGTSTTTLNGTVNATTPAALTNSTQIATTAFVRADNNVKAWVNFNGTGTVAIRASFNVSSITDNGVGNYTVNFTTAMADTNYAVSGSADAVSSKVSLYGPGTGTIASASSANIGVSTAGGVTGLVDAPQVHVAILR